MYCTNENNEKDLFVPTFRDNLLVSLKDNKNKFVQIIESIQNNIYNQSTQKEKNATKIYEAIKCVNLL